MTLFVLVVATLNRYLETKLEVEKLDMDIVYIYLILIILVSIGGIHIIRKFGHIPTQLWVSPETLTLTSKVTSFFLEVVVSG